MPASRLPGRAWADMTNFDGSGAAGLRVGDLEDVIDQLRCETIDLRLGGRLDELGGPPRLAQRFRVRCGFLGLDFLEGLGLVAHIGPALLRFDFDPPGRGGRDEATPRMASIWSCDR